MKKLALLLFVSIPAFGALSSKIIVSGRIEAIEGQQVTLRDGTARFKVPKPSIIEKSRIQTGQEVHAEIPRTRLNAMSKFLKR